MSKMIAQPDFKPMHWYSTEDRHLVLVLAVRDGVMEIWSPASRSRRLKVDWVLHGPIAGPGRQPPAPKDEADLERMCREFAAEQVDAATFAEWHEVTDARAELAAIRKHLKIEDPEAGAEEIIAAIETAVAHRDIKPENPEAAEGHVRVRIPVLTASDGRWSAYARVDQDDSANLEVCARDWGAEQEGLSWVEATVPLPSEPETVEGTVVGG